jgi:hypothetical protein
MSTGGIFVIWYIQLSYSSHQHDGTDRVLPFGKMFRATDLNDGVAQTITVVDGYRHHSTEF